MRIHKLARQITLNAALGIGMCLATLPASAQDWPARNVTIVVPLGAGSASDIMARVMAEQLTRQLGQTFVVENRPGAGGTIGANQVAKSAPDGYTMLAYGALGTANALYSKLPYDTLADFTPVIPFGIQPLSIVTAPSKGYKTLGDLIAAGKAKPGSLNYTSAGVGTASHFAAVRLLVSAGIEAQHIPFKGAAEAVTEVMTGRADFSPQIFTTTLPLLTRRQAGCARGQRAEAHLDHAGGADHGRSRLEVGFGLSVLQRVLRAVEDAARGGREAASGSGEGAAGAGGAGALQDARRRADADEPRAVRQVLPRRRRGSRRAGKDGENPDAVVGQGAPHRSIVPC